MKKGTKAASLALSSVILLNGFNGIIQPNNVQAYTAVKAIDAKSELTVGQTVNGFKLESKQWIEDVQSTAMIFTHEKTGARLLYLQNDDKNKVFSATFRTPVYDETGVNHVLEHSVLCGSKNYPVKDPFTTLGKQSLNTYLNAATAKDHTMYPVASMNDNDFNNLMGVYLDAVFYPNIYNEPKILKQEGWHYEIDTETGELVYNGVVYNEMKGVFSSPSRVLSNKIFKSLFPDTLYGKESGGDPKSIPELTYEGFVNTHKTYYHPSNSYLYLYGDLDIQEKLKFINDSYLSKFNRKEIDSKLEIQKPFNKKVETTCEYSISKDADTKDKTYLTSNYVVGQCTDIEEQLGILVLQAALLDYDDSPLKKAFLENGFNNVYGIYRGGNIQPTYSIYAQDTNESEKRKFEKVINDTLKQLAKDGFDKEFVNSVINSLEFDMRSTNSTADRGMSYMNTALRGWIYDKEPTMYLEEATVFQKVKDKIGNGYLQELITKYMITNNHCSLVIMKPVAGLNEKNAEELKKELAKYKASLSKEEVDKIIKEQEELKAWQSEEDSEENLAKMPKLTIKDINPDAEEIPTVEKEEKGIKVLSHPLFTNGIAYTSLYFDTSTVPQDKIHYLQLLANLLGKVDTEKYNYKEISNELLANTGGVSFGTTCYADKKDSTSYSPKMKVNISSLNNNLSNSFELLEQLINHSKFEDKQRIQNLVHLIKANNENYIIGNGRRVALDRAEAYFSESAKYMDSFGIPYYNFICDLDENFDAKYDEMIKNLKEVKDLVFNKENLVVSYTGDEKNYEDFAKSFNGLANKIQDKKLTKQEYKFDFSKKSEAIAIPSQVQYVVKAGDLSKENFNYSGKMNVLENILTNDYLYPEIRLKGGAYGQGIFFTRNAVFLHSYRDPHLKNTLDVYNKAFEFLKNFDADEEEMTNYIIGAIGSMDYLKNPSTKGAIADKNYFTGVTQQDIQLERYEVLFTSVEDIRDFANTLETLMKQNYYTVVGGEKKIDENKDLFDEVITPIK